MELKPKMNPEKTDEEIKKFQELITEVEKQLSDAEYDLNWYKGKIKKAELQVYIHKEMLKNLNEQLKNKL